MNYNRVILAGRLTRDPELRYTGGGKAVTDLGLAINRTSTRDGQRHESTTFVDVTAWEKQAEIVCKHFRKGQPIFIEGRLTFEEWNDQSGAKRSKLKVILERFEFVGPKQEGGDDLPPGLRPETREVIRPSQRAAGSESGDSDTPF